MDWIRTMREDELPDGERQVVKIGERSILLIHHEGQIYAMASACPHMRLPLKRGNLTGDGAIVCPWHHSAFDLRTGDAAETVYRRSDVCAVPAASIVGEAMVAWVLADALRDKLGGDSLAEMTAHWTAWRRNA